ncbi:CpsD/CapB family tyrosine-protein kinase [Alicyclobacillus macrosporangiidus]|uniref:non-specific protein-tyrosine kinase n=1 Tax=Alicyclobacillus macrosporangiidus TaxID=392015 RepID=A0A1I7G5F9_9BACL|nr:CpsD/CapB family tyrosine-protein kinase [Alicyclobacillus macrosporangiidus]SFU43674.1 capsular exopolysaccharide family [Alicyclobacillus macrosporangiidus]
MALSNRNPQPITIAQPKSPVSEAYRNVRTNIQFSTAVNGARTLMFTSSVPEEGKTSTATNVAVVSAQAGKRVLLVDADLRKPQVHHRFQVSNLDGLSTVLIRERSLEECVIASRVPNLFLVPSGPIPPNPSEMLSSRMFVDFLQHCADEYDLVMIDTPPVLSVTDALIVSRQTDGVVFVVNALKTNRNLARQAVAALEQVNARVLGVVLNRVQQRDRQYGYAYSYYYASEEKLSM